MHNERKQTNRNVEPDRDPWFASPADKPRTAQSQRFIYWDDESDQEVPRLRKSNRRADQRIKRQKRE